MSEVPVYAPRLSHRTSLLGRCRDNPTVHSPLGGAYKGTSLIRNRGTSHIIMQGYPLIRMQGYLAHKNTGLPRS